MQYIKTTVGSEGHPQIFYLPKEHNDKTRAKFEASIASIEEEIKIAKSSFEEDLLKIESKMSQNPESLMRDEDLLHEDDFDDNDETENKPRSVITVAKPPKRERQDSHRKDQDKPEPDKSMRITIKNETGKRPKRKPGKKPSSEKSSRKRKD